MEIVLVAGTWDADAPWIFDPASPFRRTVSRAGHTLARNPNTMEFFYWPAVMAGIPFVNRGAHRYYGVKLAVWLLDLRGPLYLVGHSHGGNVAAWAIAELARYGRKVAGFTSVSMPVRSSVPYRETARNCGFWQHVISERDLTQARKLAGQLFDGDVSLERRVLIPGVSNVTYPREFGHSGLLKDPVKVNRWIEDCLFEAMETGEDARRLVQLRQNPPA